MRALGLLTIVLLCSCGQSKSPVGPQALDDGGHSANCESIADKSTALYQRAAINEGVAANLTSDFVEANVHMVMVDCHADPGSVIPCVAASKSAAGIESGCLLPLDEAGNVEGAYFSRR